MTDVESEKDDPAAAQPSASTSSNVVANVCEFRDLAASNLPLSDCDYAFAYGSAALPQQGQDPAQKMADFILLVPDALRFHRVNLERNRSHYSAFGRLGARAIADYQKHWGAQVFFNTMVRSSTHKRLFKYGVIETGDAIEDLLDWNHLYTSGRLQKPVVHIIPLDEIPSAPLQQAIHTNLVSAVHCALLLLPAAFTWMDFHTTVCNLSYAGDFRQLVGEDRNKVSNIVTGGMAQFDRLYLPILEQIDQVYLGASDSIAQERSPSAIYHHLNLLPRRVLWNIHSEWRHRKGILLRNSDLEDVIYELAHQRRTPELVRRAVAQISRRSSITQTLKNIPSAGMYKSVMYAMRKLRKMITSIR